MVFVSRSLPRSSSARPHRDPPLDEHAPEFSALKGIRFGKARYIVHAYSNFEKKVAESIRDRRKPRPCDLFDEILFLPEKVMEVARKEGRSRAKFFRATCSVKCELTDDAYHLIKNTPKVTAFSRRQEAMPIPTPRRAHLNQVEEGVVRKPRSSSRWASRWGVGRTFASFSGTWRKWMKTARGSRLP